MSEGPDFEERRFFDEELKEDLRTAGRWSRRYWEYVAGIGFVVLLIGQLLLAMYSAQPKIKAHKEPIRYAERVAKIQLVPNYNLRNAKFRALADVTKRYAGSPSEMKGMIAALYPDALPPLEPRPASGVVWQDERPAMGGGVLRIDATRTTDFDSLVALTYHTREGRVTPQSRQIYVRGGEVVSVMLPQGTYFVRIRSGSAWFGVKEGFGPLASEVAFEGLLIAGDNERAWQDGVGGYRPLITGEMYDPYIRGAHHGYKLTLVPSRDEKRPGVGIIRCVRLKRAETYGP